MQISKSKATHSKNILLAILRDITKKGVERIGLNEACNEVADAVIDEVHDSANSKLSDWITKIYENKQFSSRLEEIYKNELNNLINGRALYEKMHSLIEFSSNQSQAAVFKDDIISSIDEWRKNEKIETGVEPLISNVEILTFLDKLYHNIEIKIATDNDLQEFWFILRNIRNTENLQSAIEGISNQNEISLEMLTALYNNIRYIEDSTEEYDRKFYAPLCVHKGERENIVNLKDVFVMPDVRIDGLQNKLDETVREYLNGNAYEALLLLAHGGFGKTSFLSYMAANKDYFCYNRPLHIIRLRDHSNVTIDKLCDDIADNKKREKIAKNAVIVFDGLDELCMIKNENVASNKAKARLIMEALIRGFYEFDGSSQRKIIITSRPGFVALNNDEECKPIELNGDFTKIRVIKAEYIPFDEIKRREFVQKMEKADPRITNVDKKVGCDYLKTIANDNDESEVFSSPFILYLICCVKLNESINIDASKLGNPWYLFRKIFFDFYMKSPYKNDNGQRKLEENFYNNREQIYKITCESAFEMYKKGLGKEDFIHFSNNNEENEKLKECYALSCYFNKVNEGVVEFSHNYIRDFFICEYILGSINELLGACDDFTEEKGRIIADWCSENLLYYDLGFDTEGNDPAIIDFISDYFRCNDDTYKNFDVINNDNIHFLFDHFAENGGVTAASLVNVEKLHIYLSFDINYFIFNIVINTQEIFSGYMRTQKCGIPIKWLSKSHIPNSILNGFNMKIADMTDVDLSDNNVFDAYYSSSTVFRKGFDPQAHGMIYQIEENELEKKLSDIPVFMRRKMKLFIFSNKFVCYPGHICGYGKYDPVGNTMIDIESVCMTPNDCDSVIDIDTLCEGEGIRFGNYEWYILNVDFENRKMLITSKYCVSVLQFHDKEENVTWEKCSLRRWLNSEFIKEFSEFERNRIVEMETGNYITGISDKIFILSKQKVTNTMDLINRNALNLLSNNIIDKNIDVFNILPTNDFRLDSINERFTIFPALWLSF